MAPRPDQGKTHPLAVEKATRLFNKTYVPLYVGQVALEVSLSLDRTVKLLGELVDIGKIRLASVDEKHAHDIDARCDVYIKV